MSILGGKTMDRTTCSVEDRPSGLVAGENDPRCRFFSFTAANRPLL